MEKETLELIVGQANLDSEHSMFIHNSKVFFLRNKDQGIDCLTVQERVFNAFNEQCRNEVIKHLHDFTDEGIAGTFSVIGEDDFFSADIQCEKLSSYSDDENRTCIRGLGDCECIAVDGYNNEYLFSFEIVIGG